MIALIEFPECPNGVFIAMAVVSVLLAIVTSARNDESGLFRSQSVYGVSGPLCAFFSSVFTGVYLLLIETSGVLPFLQTCVFLHLVLENLIITLERKIGPKAVVVEIALNILAVCLVAVYFVGMPKSEFGIALKLSGWLGFFQVILAALAWVMFAAGVWRMILRWLYTCALAGSTICLKKLCCTDVDYKDMQFLSIYAAQNGHIKVVKALLDRNRIIDRGDAFRAAVESGHSNIVALLLSKRVTVPTAYSGWENQLTISALKTLLDSGWDVNEWDGWALRFVAKGYGVALLETLLSAGADVHAGNDGALRGAAENGYVEMVKALLDAGADVHAVDDDALHAAAQNGHAEIVQALLVAGVDVNAKDSAGITPLCKAAEKGHTETVKALLAAGADVHALNDNALHVAVPDGHAEIVKALLAAGAYVNAKYKDGKTPLHQAAGNGHAEIVKALLAAGADAKAADDRGYTAMRYAIEAGDRDCVLLLLCAGQYMPVMANDGLTPLQAAVQKENVTLVSLMLEFGAVGMTRKEIEMAYARCPENKELANILDCYLCNMRVETSEEKEKSTGSVVQEFLEACGAGDSPKVNILLKQGAEPDGRAENGASPLCAAAAGGHVDIICILCKTGAAVDGTDAQGMTPLMHACRAGKTDAVNTLVSLGADVFCSDAQGRTAEFMARQSGDEELSLYLRSLMGGM